MDKRATNEYPLHDLLQRRWSPRAFAATPISTEVLASLFEAARWSPSASNEQPWRFLVAQKGTTAFEKLSSTLSERNLQWAGNAPIFILTLAKTITSAGKPSRHAYYDVGQAVSNLTAQATAHNLFLHQMGGFNVVKVRELFNIPAEYDPVTVIAIGYYGDTTSLNEDLQQRENAQRVRKSLDEIVFDGEFDQPLHFPSLPVEEHIVQTFGGKA